MSTSAVLKAAKRENFVPTPEKVDAVKSAVEIAKKNFMDAFDRAHAIAQHADVMKLVDTPEKGGLSKLLTTCREAVQADDTNLKERLSLIKQIIGDLPRHQPLDQFFALSQVDPVDEKSLTCALSLRLPKLVEAAQAWMAAKRREAPILRLVSALQASEAASIPEPKPPTPKDGFVGAKPSRGEAAPT